ncbi:MAG: murein biosynthesis integral membrane protein MurJ [Actinomycetales bacterium]|nr:murein biosynthesis integral membrane protein MurJ [Actinomycetales bacterium]
MSTAAASGSIGRASAVLASGTVVSRILGFVNLAVLTTTIGLNNPGANAFAVANQLPNSIFLLVAGGLLNAVLVPQIVKAGLHDDGGQRFVNKLVTLGGSVFLVVTLLAVLAAPVLVGLYTIGARGEDALSEQGVALATAFAYWCLPQVFFWALFSLVSEVLNARGVFGPWAWAPVVNNVVAISTTLAFGTLFGFDPAHQDPASWSGPEVAFFAGGITLGVVLQTVTLLLFWRRTGLGFRPDFRWKGVGLGATGRAAGWMFGMIVVNQLAGLVETNVALTAGGGDEASTAALRVAWAIFVLPHSLITVSLAAPYFTRMSGHARDGDLPGLARDLSSALRTVVLLTVGAGAAIAAAALPFSAVFANRIQDVPSTAWVLGGYLLGLASYSAIFLVHRGFYALGDTRTPFLIQCVQAVIFTAGALAALLLPTAWTTAGVSTAISVAGAVQAVLAALVLRRRFGGHGGRRVLTRFGIYALATVPAAAAGLGTTWLLGGFPPVAGEPVGFALSGKLPAILSTGVVGLVALAVYLGVLALARVPELRELGGAIARLLPARLRPARRGDR